MKTWRVPVRVVSHVTVLVEAETKAQARIEAVKRNWIQQDDTDIWSVTVAGATVEEETA